MCYTFEIGPNLAKTIQAFIEAKRNWADTRHLGEEVQTAFGIDFSKCLENNNQGTWVYTKERK